MKQNNHLIPGVVISLVIGYIIGGYIGIPGVDTTLLSGDISKVNTNAAKPLSQEAVVFQQRIQNDSTFRNETLATLSVIDERVNQFKDLTDSTAIITKGIKDLKESVEKISEMKDFAKKAQKQADDALTALTDMSEGKKNVADYEQLSQNTFIAYTLIDRQKEVARALVDNIDTYLYNSSKNEKLAQLRSEWVAFCGDGAILDGDKADQTYWNKKAVMAKVGDTPLRPITGIVFNNYKKSKKTNIPDSKDILCTSAK